MNNTAEKQVITEEMHPEKEWFSEAKKQTMETLPTFMAHLMNDYVHDYGTIVHAVSACAIAAAWAANSSGSGGITGFQASFVMWDFVKQWQYERNKSGLRMLDFDKMLFPQYEHVFAKTIKTETWERLQAMAKKKLAERATADHPVHPVVMRHWQSIVDGHVPFGYAVFDGD